MKAEELMIGNWVMAPNHRTDSYEIVKVRNIYHYLDEEDAIADWYGNVVDMEDVKPIPLTAEILEKNGFSKTDAYIFEDDYEHQILIYLKDENNTGGAYTYIDAHCGCLDISEMPVNHVHELQHALRLCCIEKEITL